MVYLRLTDTGGSPGGHNHRGIALVLKCSVEDRETLHLKLGYYSLGRSHSLDPREIRFPERSPAARFLDYLRPLSLGKVIELRMEGFVGEWGLQSVELRFFLERMPALRRIKASDDSSEMFSLALGTMEHNVIIEGV